MSNGYVPSQSIRERDRREDYKGRQSMISYLSEEYKMPPKYIESQLYKQDLDLYKHIQSLETDEEWKGGRQTLEGKPELGYPSFRTMKEPGSGPRSMGTDSFDMSSRDWMEMAGDEKRIMAEMQKGYGDYKSKIRRTAEDKIMNGFLQQDSKYKIGK